MAQPVLIQETATKKESIDTQIVIFVAFIISDVLGYLYTMKFRAKKSYGQHFLVRSDIAQQIAHSLRGVEKDDIVLEVGPGTGVLTRYLLDLYGEQLHAVEADSDMVNILKKQLPGLGDRLHDMDFLKFRLDTFLEGKRIHLIGNYPYNISSQIVFRMLDNKDRIVQMVGMFQKEVSDRIIAPSGSKTYGITSVLVQPYYVGSQVVVVPPEAFNPPPKVMSSVIRLERKMDEPITWDPRTFQKLVKATFNQRRKMLRNTLKGIFPDEWLDEKQFTLRPEQLTWQDYAALTERITAFRLEHKIEVIPDEWEKEGEEA
jgi:16S rRNA (adenine1518-N6/adenine1519-N6)-dimethyltransferase